MRRLFFILVLSMILLMLYLSFFNMLADLPNDNSGDKLPEGIFGNSINEIKVDEISRSRLPGTRQDNPEIISTHEIIRNETKTIEKSIMINSGGRLEILNSLVLINSSVTGVVITVQSGGELYINNSNITKQNITEGKGFGLKVYGQLTINNSEINHAGYETEVCLVEGCGGIKYESRYSPGLEIHSDSVKVLNSEFNYARNTSIYINSAQPIINGNSFVYNLNCISVKNSNVILNNNIFNSNFYGIDILTSEIIIQNSKFIDNWGNNIIGQDSKIVINNVTMNNSGEIIFTVGCEVIIENSRFYDNNLFEFFNSDVFWTNTTVSGLVEGLYFYNSSANINNSLFESCSYCLWLSEMRESTLENNSFYNCQYAAIEIRNTYKLQFKNNVIKETFKGLIIIDSKVSVSNNSIFNSSIFGVSDSGSTAIIENNLISYNSVGLYSYNSKSIIMNNTITNNHLGIMSYESTPQIIGNLIANNSEWGLEIINYDPVIFNNIYSDAQYSPNGLGRLRRNSVITFQVRDAYGNSIRNIRVQVENSAQSMVIDENYYGTAETLTYQIPIYEVSNSGIKTDYNPFTVSASWGNEEYGYTKESKQLTLIEGATFNLTLTLPDLYVTSDDIKISKLNPKDGDKVDFEITIHYMGTQVAAKDIEVSLTANGGVVKKFLVSFNASNEPQNQTFTIPWKVIALETDKMNIRVIIDLKNKLENHDLDYKDNNIATTSIDVEGKDIKARENLSLVQICGIIILIIVILMLLIIALLYRFRKKQQKQLEEKLKSMDIPEKKPEPDEQIESVIKEIEKQREKEKKKDKQQKKKDEKQKKKPGTGSKSLEESHKNQKTHKSMKEKLTEDLNRDVPPRIKW